MPVNEHTPLLTGSDPKTTPAKASLLSFLTVFWPIGFVAFGGPQARKCVPPAICDSALRGDYTTAL